MRGAATIVLVVVAGACRPVVELELPPDIAKIAIAVVDSDDDVVEPSEVRSISRLLDSGEPFVVGVVEPYVAIGWREDAFEGVSLEGPLRLGGACRALPAPTFAAAFSGRGTLPSESLAERFPTLTADGAPVRCPAGYGCVADECVAVAEVATTRQHTCARLASGRIACTGRNDAGQAGVGSDEREISTPRYVIGIDDAVDVDLGHLHTCAVHADGRVSCWGLGDHGQLGDGATRSSNVPVLVEGIEDGAALALGATSSCVRHVSGEVSCWGRNSNGQLGDGATFDRNLPVRAELIDDAVDITSGWDHVCAVRSNGTVRCWGTNSAGHLGSPDTDLHAHELPAPIDVVELASGDGHTCARAADGDVFCWGINSDGQVGDGTQDHAMTPTAVRLPWPAVGIVAGGRNTCAFNTQNDMFCWGQIAGGLFEVEVEREVQRVPHPQSFGPGRDLDFDIGVACRVQDADVTECWGANAYGATGTGIAMDVGRPSRVTPILSFAGVGPGRFHGCGFDAAGEIACWGRGGFGETLRTDDIVAGDPKIGARLGPVRDVVSSQFNSCARHDDGVSCWGFGHFGAGESRTSTAPVEAVGLTDPVDLDVSESHVCAVRGDGRLLCWGLGQAGLGIEDAGYAFFPLIVPGLDQALRVAVGRAFTCVLKDDASVHCFGANLFGQLGHSDPSTHLARLVAGLPPTVAIDAQFDTSCAVTRDSEVYCWGASTEWIRAIDPSGTPPVSPNQIPISEPVVDVAVGTYHACAVATSGRVWCWGFNDSGQAGVGGPERRRRVTTPAIVEGLSDIVGIAAGPDSTCVWAASGEAWCFGDNTYDQLGTPSYVPERTQVSFLP